MNAEKEYKLKNLQPSELIFDPDFGNLTIKEAMKLFNGNIKVKSNYYGRNGRIIIDLNILGSRSYMPIGMPVPTSKLNENEYVNGHLDLFAYPHMSSIISNSDDKESDNGDEDEKDDDDNKKTK